MESLTRLGSQTLQYNAQGRIAAATTAGGTSNTPPAFSYQYNSSAQRLLKTDLRQGTTATATTSTEATLYADDATGSTVLGQYSNQRSTTSAAPAGEADSTEVLWLPTASGPMPIGAQINGRLYAIDSDHLNTPRRLTNAQGQVVWQWLITGYGEVAPTTGATGYAFEAPQLGGSSNTSGNVYSEEVTFKLRYPGQVWDEETGLSYNLNRYYDGQAGRYVQSDPIGLDGGWNRFGYVSGNPLSRSDPAGLFDVFVGGAKDGTSRIVARYQQAYSSAYRDRSSSYFEWDQGSMVIEAVLAARVKNKCEPINIVGHSYGGSTAASVSRALKEAGIDVNLLVTVDPVSRVWSKGPGAAAAWVNVNATPSSSNGFAGDAWAALGGKWDDWPNGKANSYYQAPFHHNEFAKMFEFVSPGGKSALQLLLDSNSSSCTCQGDQ